MIDTLTSAAPATPEPAAGRSSGARRSGPPFGEVLAATEARAPAVAAEGAASRPVTEQPAGDAPEDDDRGATAEAVLAGLTVARAAVDKARPDLPMHASAATPEGELPAGLAVARAAVAANGASGTPGGKPWADVPSGVPAEPAAGTAVDPAPVAPVAEVDASAVASPSPTGEPPTTAPEWTAVDPVEQLTTQPAAPTADREVAATSTVPSVHVGPDAAAVDATATSADPALASTSAPAPVSSVPATPAAPAAAPASTFVARLVDAATRLESAPAPREVVLDLRDVLGGDTSISIRLVRGEVHVSVRGDLPSGEWQRELAGSLAERGFDLGSFDQRDRTDRRSADGREPGEQHPEAPTSDHDPRGASHGRPDHADARHAAGLRL